MRLIDADDYISKMEELYDMASWGEREVHFSLIDTKCNIAMMPTAVVQCKDCKQWGIHQRMGIPYCKLMHKDMPADGFCSYAERKVRRNEGMDIP